ncbi:DUF6838 family protein [Endozoicomonas ascidiicola]|uniref:DUF6838 family protein n=1 Tax=Endozoicomonas ascidiicola TaxID=1698521 RepID=UPI0012FD39B4|nr:hypothetical protein [Endozoicomonas ascidiicola]
MNHSQRVTADYPEQKIIQAIVDRLSATETNVLLGYSATGLADDLTLPAFLIQLESVQEQERQGHRVKALMSLNISAVTKTTKDTTFDLIMLVNSLRQQLDTGERLCTEARKMSFSETQFDIAPNHGHLSFADIQLTIDVIL